MADRHCLADTGPIVVVSGSCSPVTAGQIKSALANNFSEVILSPDYLTDAHLASAARDAVATLRRNQSVIIHTGPKGAIGDGPGYVPSYYTYGGGHYYFGRPGFFRGHYNGGSFGPCWTWTPIGPMWNCGK